MPPSAIQAEAHCQRWWCCVTTAVKARSAILTVAFVAGCSGAIPARRDIALETERIELSPATVRTLAQLTTPVRVVGYLDPVHPDVDVHEIRFLLDAFRVAGRGLISVQIHSPPSRSDAERAGCTPHAAHPSARRPIYRCFRVESARRGQVFDQLPDVVNRTIVENLLAYSIRLIARPRPTIGVLTGHGEATPEDGLTHLVQLPEAVRPPVDLRTIDLRGGEAPIPQGLHAILIVAPTQPIAERELRALDAFLIGGGSIAVFAGGVTFAPGDDPLRVRGAPALHGLNSWLERRGVRIEPDIVLDRASPDTLFEVGNRQGRVRLITWPEATAANGGLDWHFQLVEGLPGLTAPFVSRITLDRERLARGGQPARIFATTSAGSFLREDSFDLDLSVMLSGTLPAASGRQAFGIAIDGPLASAFDELVPGTVHPQGAPARLLVVSSSAVVSEQTLTALDAIAGQSDALIPANLTFFYDVMDWLVRDDDLAHLRNEALPFANSRSRTARLFRAPTFVRIASDAPRGLLSPEAIRGVVLRHLGQVTHCHELGLGRHPDLEGRVVVRFIIGGTGAVLESIPTDSSLPQDVAQCIADAVHTLTFPPPEGGGIVTVNYPFNLQRAE